MKLVDANVLLYAVNRAAPHHEQSVRWLDNALVGQETIGFSWLVILAFARLSTKLGVVANPLSVDEAVELLEGWLGAPSAVIVEPRSNHIGNLATFLKDVGVAGNLTSDAHLAAIALEYRATIVSYDRDFDRIKGIRWERPEFPEGL